MLINPLPDSRGFIYYYVLCRDFHIDPFMPSKELDPKRNTYKAEPVEEVKKEKKTTRQKSTKTRAAHNSKPFPNPFRPLINLLKNDKFQRVAGLFFLLFTFYLLIAFTSYLFTWKADDNIFNSGSGGVFGDDKIVAENWMGKIGAALSYLFIKKWFGISSFLILFLSLISGLKLFLKITLLPIGKSFRYSFFGIIWLSVTAAFFFQTENTLILGGIFGYESNQWLNAIIGKTGTGILLFFALLAFLIIAWNVHRIWQRKPKPDIIEEISEDHNLIYNELKNDPLQQEDTEILEEEMLEFDMVERGEKNQDASIKEDIPKKEEIGIENIEFNIENTLNPETNKEDQQEKTETDHFKIGTPYDPTLDLKDYKFPPLDLLKEYDSGNISVQNEELEANKNKIIKTLRNYSIEIEKINATIGPTVTLYEIVPAPGIRISKIKNLEDDIALSLSALGIRIIAPMPGKGTIGIEVPNQNPKIVSMRSVLGSDAFIESQFDLPIALGKTISNKPFIADLAKMPHVLIAGATGQGKSVGLNAIISSLLYKKHPSQLKFVMVDPKKVELTLFSKIERHYLAKLPDVDEAILTDNKKVIRTLNALCILMDERYELLKAAQVRNIKEYNVKFIDRKLNPEEGHKFMPYIVLIVDEFADLYMTAGKEVEYAITRLAQLARAIGIHLIIATQRPSVNVITGTIKANFPVRIAFRVSAKVDSRTILDASGADQLIGRGDMLISTGSDILRLQCAFLDTPEVEAITEFIGSQRGYPSAYDLPECPEEEGNDGENTLDPSERDPLFADAARILVAHQHGSTSLLQRKLKLGYNRAGRIIDQLEAAGILGPFEGSKAREVRIKDLQTLEQLLENRNTIL
jgi:DNA segregation ATPase FtsK/SpoIIIE, S-DNA-T family